MFGLKQIVNTSGSIIIDQTYKNLVLVQKGVISANNKVDGYSDTWYADITIAGPFINPIIAIRCDATWVSVPMSNINPDGSLYAQFFVDRTIEAGNQSLGPITWYIFDEQPDQYTGPLRWGWRVMKPGTKVSTFDSRFKYMKVMADWQYNPAGSPAIPSLPAGRTYAVSTSLPGMSSFVVGSGSERLTTHASTGFRIQGNIMSPGRVRVYTIPPGFPVYQRSNMGLYNFIDVTGM